MVKKNLFNTGFDNVKEEAKRQEKVREASRNRVNRFFLSKDGDEADIYFLNEEPVNYQAHTLPQTTSTGKTFYKDFLCTGEDCEYCAEYGNPSFKSAFLIIDNTPYTTKENKVIPQTLKMYAVGTRLSTQLARLSSKYGLVNREYTVVRNGTGTATTYALEKGDKIKLSNDEITKLLPEEMREYFDGTDESVQTIIQELLVSEDSLNKGFKDEDDEDDEDLDDGTIEEKIEEETPRKVSKFKKLTTTKQTSRKTPTTVIKKRK